ncbi:MAG: low molecular weight phosphotyrosine protein phosphatase [Gammaproteobacteria bacterium]|nr:low molecular weight phosphotyrosine protein phosphatase [Gammaproteobacteria bacterium]
MKKVLFVCMGNICRSPTAEAVFTKLVTETGKSREWVIDSAGTHTYHIGHSPDTRSQKTAKQRGYEMSHLRARQVCAEDFQRFDWILAADQSNLNNLKRIAPQDGHAKLGLIQDFSSQPDWIGEDVPDPYYGGQDGFSDVLNRLENACIEFLRQNR